jgi:hypothetical protein
MRRAIPLVCVLLLCASCMQPRKWPIPELVVPSGAVPAKIPSKMLQGIPADYLSPDGTHTLEKAGSYSWMYGFNYARGWDTLVKHVATSVEPLGYKPYSGGQMRVPSIPGVPDGTLARGWLSPDKKYLVAIINVAFIKDRAPGTFEQSDAQYVMGVDDQTYYEKKGMSSPNQ